MPIDVAWTAPAIDETIRPDDEAAIRTCILDYFEGWFDGDVVRMDRALHPGLAKHSLDHGRTASNALDLTTKKEMIEATRRGVGRTRDVPDRNIRVEIAAISGNIACAIAHSAVYVEFLLLARTEQGWQITGALWRWAEGHGPRA